MRRNDTLIVGAGPAGAATAIGLALAGSRPVLLDRTREVPDHLCGGFLSWSTLARLERLGIHSDRLSGHPIDHLTIFGANRQVAARLPAPAMALSRRRLDTLLVERAVWLGVGVERGVTVRAFEDGQVRLADGASIAPVHLVLATGKQELRGAARNARDDNPTAGIRWRLTPGRRLRRMVGSAIELHLFRDGYAGLVLQEESANLCLAVRQSRLREVEGSPERLLSTLAEECPALGARLAASLGIETPQAVARVPYGWYARGSADAIYRVGDQAGVIPSLAGEGIAIALASGAAASSALLRSEPAHIYQRVLAGTLRRPIWVGAGVWRLAESRWGARLITSSVGVAPATARWIANLTRSS